MRFTLLPAGACLLCLLSSVPGVAKAQESKDHEVGKYYLAVFGGVAYPEDLQNVRDPATSQSFTDSTADAVFPESPDSIVGVKAGFIPDKDSTWFGLESEYFTTTGKFTQSGAANKATLEVRTLALNFLLRYPEAWIEPYIGVGPSLVWASSQEFGGSRTNTTVGLNMLGGFRVPIVDKIMLFAEYKHHRVHFDRTNRDFDYRLHAFVAGLGVVF